MKINVSIKKKPKSSHDVLHARKFCMHTDQSHDMMCTRMLNRQLPHVTVECAIHLLSSNGWGELWPEPMTFLVDTLNHAH